MVTVDNNKFRDEIEDIEAEEKKICEKCNKNKIPERFYNSHIKYCDGWNSNYIGLRNMNKLGIRNANSYMIAS